MIKDLYISMSDTFKNKSRLNLRWFLRRKIKTIERKVGVMVSYDPMISLEKGIKTGTSNGFVVLIVSLIAPMLRDKYGIDQTTLVTGLTAVATIIMGLLEYARNRYKHA